MPRGRKLASLTLTDEQQNQLQGIGQSATLPYALVVRARIILASAEGLTNAAVATRVGVKPHTVGKWRRRFLDAGIQGLHDEIPARTPPVLRRRQGGQRDQPRVAGDTRHRHALEHAHPRAGHGRFQEHGAALARPLRRQTALGADLQAVG